MSNSEFRGTMQTTRTSFTTIDSTNKWAKEHAASFDRGLLHVITAHEQSAGQGREGRPWLSPPGQNLYVTYLFFIDPSQKDLGNISQLMGVLAVEVLEKLQLTLKLKWPNDLWIDKKKVGGILTEIFTIRNNNQAESAVALGIGINVNMDQETLNSLPIPATSLAIEKGSQLPVEAVLEPLTAALAKTLPEFLQKGFPPFLAAYRKALVHQPGEKLTFHTHRHILTGKFLEIDIGGRLHLELENGEVKVFSSGEIRQERAK